MIDLEKIERILAKGGDVVIKTKNRDGKLVDIVYEQTLHIQEIVPTKEKK